MSKAKSTKVKSKQYTVKCTSLKPTVHLGKKEINQVIKMIESNKIETKDNTEISIFTEGKKIIEELAKLEFNPHLNTFIHATNVDINRINSLKKRDFSGILLDGSFSGVSYIPGLSTPLYEHQKKVVKAMIDFEYWRRFQQRNMITPYNFTFNAGVLSEPVGSGKTIMIIALILGGGSPRIIADIMSLQYYNSSKYCGIIRKKIQDTTMFLRPNLIFVNSTVVIPWEQAIKTYTKLKVFSIHKVTELKVLLKMIEDLTVNQYDIILIKNGTITVPVVLPDGIELDEKNCGTTPYIYNILANIKDRCWNRVIIDDFDTSKTLINSTILARFTWYVSSTRKKYDLTHNDFTSKLNSASDLLYQNSCSYGNITNNEVLFNLLNIRCNLEFSKENMNIPVTKYHIVEFDNPNDNFIGFLAGLGGDINQITEMLNGDAIGEAAERLNIKTKSVGDIFRFILGNQYKEHIFAGDLLSYIDYVTDNEERRLPMSENPDPEDTYYGKLDLLQFKDLNYKYPNVNHIISDTQKEYVEIKSKSGIAIERVKDNIKHGKCPICKLSLDNYDDIIIVKCCGAVFCAADGIAAQKLNNGNKLQNGTCSNCRANLNIKDLIMLGADIDIEKIINEDLEEEQPLVKVTNINKPRTKYSAMVDIINGKILSESKRIDLNIPNTMKGSIYMKDTKIRKVLIFANYDETLKEVIKELSENKIKYWKLHGGINEINRDASAYTNYNETCALVINSTKYCSGLNLQTSTDLIFAHRIIDRSVESQVIGRGLRIGRTSQLKVWYFTYKNETSSLVQSHNVRYLSAKELEEEEAAENKTVENQVSVADENQVSANENQVSANENQVSVADENQVSNINKIKRGRPVVMRSRANDSDESDSDDDDSLANDSD